MSEDKSVYRLLVWEQLLVVQLRDPSVMVKEQRVQDELLEQLLVQK